MHSSTDTSNVQVRPITVIQYLRQPTLKIADNWDLRSAAQKDGRANWLCFIFATQEISRSNVAW
jgi:hypothetical protein